MPIDHRFDFFGMNFEATNVDDTVAPADKAISISAKLDHVAGINEAVSVEQSRRVPPDIAMRRPARADPQRSILDLHLDPIGVRANNLRGKPLQSIIDGKC